MSRRAALARSRGSPRQRGATYTLMILTASVGLLAAGATLVEASRDAFRIAAEDARQLRAREAAFAGVRWASAAARATPGPGEGRLALAGAAVAVRWSRRDDGALLVTSVADLRDRALRLDAVLLVEGERFRLETFEARREASTLAPGGR